MSKEPGALHLQLISLFSGVIVQYEAVEDPLRHLRRYTQARAANPGGLIILDRPHSKLMIICYRLQLAFFQLRFLQLVPSRRLPSPLLQHRHVRFRQQVPDFPALRFVQKAVLVGFVDAPVYPVCHHQDVVRR